MMDLSPKTLQLAAQQGLQRTRNFRAARLEYIKSYVGHHYDRPTGVLGDEPLNFAFNAVRVLVPSLVTRHPQAVVETDYLAYRQYAELLALALNFVSKKMKLPAILQRGLVDAIFTIGIFKTGLSTSQSLAYFGEEAVDPGQIYVCNVSLDNFTFDPSTRRLDNSATFLGERLRVEKQFLFDSGLFDSATIEKLPIVTERPFDSVEEVRRLSMGEFTDSSSKLHEYIDLLELWLPESNLLVTLPVTGSSDEYLRVEKYYGPSDGMYTFLSLTPPVPDNPLPVALAGIWEDLHILGNKVAKKMLDQAIAQKDILGYRRTNADDAQEIVDAKNLDAVAMDDPSSAQMFSYGGINPVNERASAVIDMWFNQYAGNPNLMGGQAANTEVATIANILNQNAATSVTYMGDNVYAASTDILRKIAWYLHTDPLIKLPLIQREMVPAEYRVENSVIQMVSPPSTVETQLFLTPEVRRGDFLDFAFDIEQQSMAPVNWNIRLQQLEMLAVRIIPAAAQAAQVMAQIGQPFSFRAYVIRAAKLMGFDWIDEIFQDPELLAYSMRLTQMGPQSQKASAAGTRQNRGAVIGRVTPTEQTQQRQYAQTGAAMGQAELPIREK